MDVNRNFPCGWEDYVGGDDVYQPWDFDYKGPLPASEPETQIAMRLMEEVAPVCLLESARDIDKFVDGSVLVTSTTDPDWVPIMKRAAAREKKVSEQADASIASAAEKAEAGKPAPPPPPPVGIRSSR